MPATITRVSSGSAALNPSKSVWKRGMKKHEQENDHAHGEGHQHGGIHHRRGDLGAQFLFARLEIGDLREHDIKEAAGLARLDHGRVDAREHVGRFGHGDLASGAPSMTASWSSRHFAPAAGLDAFLVEDRQRAAESGTPAVSRLESERVKSSSAGEGDFLGLERVLRARKLAAVGGGRRHRFQRGAGSGRA